MKIKFDSVMQDFTLQKLKEIAPIIAVTVGVMAIITAISIAYFVNWWRLRKSLAYIVQTNTAIFSIDPEIGKNIQILYGGKQINNARLFVIKFINDGRQPVDDKDFKTNIEFVFSENGQILSSEITELSPADLSVKQEIVNGNILSITPLLLNKGDFFEIKGVINSNDDEIKCTARVSGVKEVKRIHQSKPNFSLSFIKVISSLLILLFAFLLLVFGSSEFKSLGLALLVLLLYFWLPIILSPRR